LVGPLGRSGFTANGNERVARLVSITSRELGHPGFKPGAQRISAQNEWEWGNSPVKKKKKKVLQQTFPELASYSRNINISVHEMKSTMPLITHFHLPLSTEAYDQSVQLNTIIQNLHFNLSLINGVIYGVQPFSLHRKHTRT
jgi:hypothetical protein